MAADDRSWLEDVVEDSVLADIVRIQAWVRGYVVRKQMKEIRQLYEDIVHDLDGLAMKVVWSHDYVSCPRVRKGKEVGVKVVEHCMSRETCSRSSNQRLVPSGSVRSETKIQGAASLVSVSTNTQVPGQPSLAVHSHGTGADQCKQIAERENRVQMTARRPPVTGTNATCSSTQTQESDFCVPQTHNMFGQYGTVMPQTSDVTQHGQVADHVNKTKGLFCQQLPSQDQICPLAGSTSQDQICPLVGATSQDQICPPESARSHADSVWVASLGGRSSAEVAADKIIYDRVENDGSAETLQPEKLPADVSQPHQHFEKPCCHTVSHQWASLEPQAGQKSPGEVVREASGVVESVELPAGRHQLLQLNNSIAMELLWVQQAISSRKHYLRLKEQLQ